MRTNAAGYGIATAVTLATLLALVFVAGGCTSPPPQEAEATDTEPARDIYVAFAGGGWRAHTAHAGWIVGLLDNQTSQQTLADVFTNVSAVSSNSGGSWFNVMLSYSKDFRELIESTDVSSTYTTDPGAYFLLEKARIQDLADTGACKDWKDWPALDFVCVVREGDFDWEALVQDIVFYPYSMSSKLSTTTLGSPRQSWADGKSLLLAATILTDQAVLAGSVLIKYYTDAQDLTSLNVAPVTFSSIPAGRQVPNFFPSASAPFDLTYGWNTRPSEAVTAAGNVVDPSSDAVQVVTAAAASSAAVGYVASEAINQNNLDRILGDFQFADWELALIGDGLAVYFNLPDPSGSTLDVTRSTTPPTENAHANRDARFVQLADGGALDNSAVVQLVSYHQQQNGTSVPFDIVAFDAVEATYTPTRDGQSFSPVGTDIAYLFGDGFTDLGEGKEGVCTEATGGSTNFCVVAIDDSASPQVFAGGGIFVDSTWTYQIDDDHELIYTRYQVTTVDSTLMGVHGGSSGTLHAFTTSWSGAGTAPVSTSQGGKLGDEDWAAYSVMFDAIQKGLADEGGLEHLRTAFGLPTSSP